MLYAKGLNLLTGTSHHDSRRTFIIHSIMALPNKYQNGSIDSAVRGVYRASPIKLMIYGNGRLFSKSI
jgi:hypothetical protein